MSKTIFTAAITGAIHTPAMSPFLPYTPEHMIEECVASHAAGAANERTAGIVMLRPHCTAHAVEKLDQLHPGSFPVGERRDLRISDGVGVGQRIHNRQSSCTGVW